MEAAAKACPLLPPTHNPDPEKADLEKAEADRGPTKADGAGTHVEGGEGSKRMVHGLFVVLDASGINFLDLSGLKGLVDISRSAHEQGGGCVCMCVSALGCGWVCVGGERGVSCLSFSVCPSASVCVWVSMTLSFLSVYGRDLHVHGVRLLVARAKHRTRDMLRSSATLFHQLGGDKVQETGTKGGEEGEGAGQARLDPPVVAVLRLSVCALCAVCLSLCMSHMCAVSVLSLSLSVVLC
jgi:hypothetical protein